MPEPIIFSKREIQKFDAKLCEAIEDPNKNQFAVGVFFVNTPPDHATLSNLGLVITGQMALGEINRQQLKKLSSLPDVKLISLFGQSRLR